MARKQPDPPRGRGRDSNDPERALLAAARQAVVPTICLPVAIASLGASATGAGIPIAVAWPLAALALVANIACWLKVIVLWRALPRLDDDDQGWRRRRDGDSPLGPSGGPGGIDFDWPRFERDFWAHVGEKELQRERELIHA